MCVVSDATTPQPLLVKDLGEISENFGKALASVMNPANPRYDDLNDKSRVLYEGVAGFALTTAGDVAVAQGLRVLGNAIQARDYTALPSASIEHLRKVSALVTNQHYDLEISASGIGAATPTVVGATSSFNLPEVHLVSGGTTLYGKLIAVGGETTQASIKLGDGSRIDIALTKKMARRVAPKLYKTIGLIGTATWELPEWKVVAFKATAVANYDADVTADDSIKKLRKIVKDRWDHIEDVEAFVHNLRARL